MDFERRLSDICWSKYETAYGSAEIVEAQLLHLSNKDLKIATKASHDLWCGLCHQHTFISSAALPAFPFLIEIFFQAEDKLKVELLDIFLGFSICLKQSDTLKLWETKLLEALLENIEIFRAARKSSHEEISSFANEILLNLR